MRGSTVILNEILLHFICMGIITVGITVIYVCCNVDVNKNCMFGKKNAACSCPSDKGTPAM